MSNRRGTRDGQSSALAGLEQSRLLFLVIRAVQWLHLQLSAVSGDDAVPPGFASPVSRPHYPDDEIDEDDHHHAHDHVESPQNDTVCLLHVCNPKQGGCAVPPGGVHCRGCHGLFHSGRHRRRCLGLGGSGDT